MESLMSIGAKVDKKSVKEITKAMLKIIWSPGGDAVKICAINALGLSLKVENVNV
jgi:hypothetical protein